jgi:hypothetical protein
MPGRSNLRKGSKFLEAKVLIVSLSLAVTFGFWSIFSNQDLKKTESKPPDPEDPAQQVNGQVLLPLPTLSTLVQVKTGAAAQQTSVENAQQAAPLRSVSAPEQKIVQKGVPVVEIPQPVVIVESSGGGSNSAAAPAPVTTTRSSK